MTRGSGINGSLLLIMALWFFSCPADGRRRSQPTTSFSRRLQLNFHPYGWFDDNSPPDLTDTDKDFFRDACKERHWSSNKVVVVAGSKHDSSWLKLLEKEPVGLEYIVYQSDDPAKPHYFEPYANEAGAYLLFMHEYYNCLPQYVAFIHGHKQEAWHSLDMSETLHNLQWSRIPGYSDINRKGGHKWITLDHQGMQATAGLEPVATGKDAYNGSFSTFQIIEGKAYPYEAHAYLDEVQFARAYDHFFGPQGFGGMPDQVLHYCCGQFAATKEAIRGRTRQFYQDALLYMRPEHNDLTGHHHTSRIYVMGDVFTVFYAMIMGKSAVYNKEISDCVLFNDCEASDDSHASASRKDQ